MEKYIQRHLPKFLNELVKLCTQIYGVVMDVKRHWVDLLYSGFFSRGKIFPNFMNQ